MGMTVTNLCFSLKMLRSPGDPVILAGMKVIAALGLVTALNCQLCQPGFWPGHVSIHSTELPAVSARLLTRTRFYSQQWTASCVSQAFDQDTFLFTALNCQLCQPGFWPGHISIHSTELPAVSARLLTRTRFYSQHCNCHGAITDSIVNKLIQWHGPSKHKDEIAFNNLFGQQKGQRFPHLSFTEA